MSVIKNRDYILEAIDQLRRRKARPDRERICNFVSRKCGIDNRSTVADLERLVDEQVVIKVEYKGNISYRNAAKWSKLSVHKSRIEVELSDLNKLESMQDESERMSYVLRCAITELVCRDPDYLDHGVPVYELEQYLKTKDSEFFARISFNVLLSREAKAGTVVKLENGNYLLGPGGARPASTMSGSWSGSGSGVSDSELDMSNEDQDLDDSALFEDADDSPVKSPAPQSQALPPLPPLVPAPALLRQMQNHQEDNDNDVDVDVGMNGDDTAPASSNGNPEPDVDMEEDDDDLGGTPEPEREPEPDPEPQPDPEPEPDPEPDPAMNHKEQEENSGYRVGERRKRAKKKVFDPSDNNLPKAKRRGRQPAVAEKLVKTPLVTHSPVTPVNSSPSTFAANGPASNRSSGGSSVNRSSNGPAASRAQNGSSARSSNGTAANEYTTKDIKPPVPSSNKLNSIGTGAVAVCAICISAIVDGKAIQCKDCSQKAHFSCLIRGNRARFRPNTWQCMLCKTCQICSMTEDVGTIVVCTNCDEGYHVKCHIPKPKIPWKKWMCCRCAPEQKQITPEKSVSTAPSRASIFNEITVSSILKTLPQLLKPKIEEMEIEDSKIDETIPDASDWTTEDVYDFFCTKYPDYAWVFKDQDIDGRSLLLMTRNDVVNGLHLKLGPALKIYGQVKKLQLRRSGSNLLWE